MQCIDLLLPLVPGCLLRTSAMPSNMKTWLLGGDFELDSASAAAPVPVIRNATKSFEPTLAREVDRFLCAMGESFFELQPAEFASRSIGWSLIRAYYSSYFAAHALLRMTGRCVTQLDAPLSQSVMRSLQATGPTPNWMLGKSQYLVQYDEITQLLTFVDKHGAQGGSHQFVWKMFGALVSEMIKSTTALGSAYQNEALLLERISDTLTSQQALKDFSWLSSVRNSVNYGFSYSVWFPFDGFDSRQSQKLIRMLKCDGSVNYLANNYQNQSELEKFCEAVSFLVNFANAAANEISHRSNAKPFMSKSYRKLQRLVNLPTR